MRFTTAWANVLSQNVALRFVTITLSTVSLIFCIATIRLALKDPFIIERECYSTLRPQADPKHTTAEIESFVITALSKRFDSNASDSKVFLSTTEEGFRAKEQEELKMKEMSQRISVNKISKLDGTKAQVDADRTLSVGKVRSTLPFPLTVTLASTARTPGNPYGLIIQRVSQGAQEETK